MAPMYLLTDAMPGALSRHHVLWLTLLPTSTMDILKFSFQSLPMTSAVPLSGSFPQRRQSLLDTALYQMLSLCMIMLQEQSDLIPGEFQRVAHIRYVSILLWMQCFAGIFFVPCLSFSHDILLLLLLARSHCPSFSRFQLSWARIRWCFHTLLPTNTTYTPQRRMLLSTLIGQKFVVMICKKDHPKNAMMLTQYPVTAVMVHVNWNHSR